MTEGVSTGPLVCAGFGAALGVFWIVVMAGCWEWPKYDAFHDSSDEDSDMGVVMYFRRWPARFGRVRHTETKLGPFGTGDTRYREYDAVENIEKHRLVTCPPPGGRRQGYSRPEDSVQRDARLRWICGSVFET